MNTGTSRKRFRLASLVAVAALFSACSDPIAAPSAESPTFARFPVEGGIAGNNQSCLNNGINGKSPNERNQCGSPTVGAVASITNGTAGPLYFGTSYAANAYWTCGLATSPYGNMVAGEVITLTPCDLTAAPASITIDVVSVFLDVTETATVLGPITLSAPGATCVEAPNYTLLDPALVNGRAWTCTIPLVNGKPASTVQITATSAAAP